MVPNGGQLVLPAGTVVGVDPRGPARYMGKVVFVAAFWGGPELPHNGLPLRPVRSDAWAMAVVCDEVCHLVGNRLGDEALAVLPQ